MIPAPPKELPKTPTKARPYLCAATVYIGVQLRQIATLRSKTTPERARIAGKPYARPEVASRRDAAAPAARSAPRTPETRTVDQSK